MKHAADASGKPTLNVLFIWNMPLRALAKMTNGMVSVAMVDAIVRESKWWGLAGIVPALLVKLATGEGFILVWFLWFVVPILVAFVANLIGNARTNGALASADK